MGKRKRNNKEIDMDINEKLKKAREMRIRKAGLTLKQVEENSREDFRKYFAKTKRQLNIDSSMEEILWLHLKSSGFDKKEKFNEGLKHFGYKF